MSRITEKEYGVCLYEALITVCARINLYSDESIKELEKRIKENHELVKPLLALVKAARQDE